MGAQPQHPSHDGIDDGDGSQCDAEALLREGDDGEWDTGDGRRDAGCGLRDSGTGKAGRYAG